MRARMASNGRAHSGSREPWAKRTMPRMRGLALPGRAEAARPARALRERVDHFELDLHDGDHDQLRDPLERVHDEGLLAAVPAGDHELSLVVRVDEPHEVAQHDA